MEINLSQLHWEIVSFVFVQFFVWLICNWWYCKSLIPLSSQEVVINKIVLPYSIASLVTTIFYFSIAEDEINTAGFNYFQLLLIRVMLFTPGVLGAYLGALIATSFRRR